MNLTLRVANKAMLTDAIAEFTLVAADGASLPAYTAGSHIDVDLGDEIGTRSYSLIDWTGPPATPASYTIAVQREDDGDGGSMRMHALNTDDQITATTPANNFPLADETAPTVLVAGGIGITPIISLAALCQQNCQPFHLYYAGRSAAVMAYSNSLQDAFDTNLHCHTDDSNPLPLTTLFADLDAATHIYLCGPAGLIEAARSAASSAGVTAERIHVELFATPDARADDGSFEVELSSSGEVHVIPQGQTIIEVLEAAGHDLMYDCQRGDCGICQTTVISGTPDHRDVVLSDDEKAAGNVMQICVSRATSGRLVLDL
jgi:vanillate O-demethylase ferredoxin subunit